MKYLATCFALICILLLSCNSNNQKSSTKAPIVAQTSTKNKPAKQEVQVGNKVNTPDLAKANGALFLAPQDTKIKSGEEGCVSFKTKYFKDIVSMQYSINWDAEQLIFSQIKDIKLQDLQTKNFGKHIIDQGKMTFSWYDPSIRGVSLPDDAELYKICFKAKGAPGSKSKILFTEDPIVVEITAKNAQFLKFHSQPGTVVIE